MTKLRCVLSRNRQWRIQVGGGGVGGHPDLEIREGQSQKSFRPLRPQFGLKIRGGGGPPGPLPGSPESVNDRY